MLVLLSFGADASEQTKIRVAFPSDDGNEAVGSAMAVDLQERNVDLLGPLLKNEQTEKMFEFPEKSYGTVYTTLCALSSGCRIIRYFQF